MNSLFWKRGPARKSPPKSESKQKRAPTAHDPLRQSSQKHHPAEQMNNKRRQTPLHRTLCAANRPAPAPPYSATILALICNRTQAVRLPAETRFPDEVKQVHVRVVGKDRVLSPIESTWDSFFTADESVTDDFMEDREFLSKHG